MWNERFILLRSCWFDSFCYTICAGLGSIYENELRDNMDRHSELKIVDTVLWKNFEELV